MADEELEAEQNFTWDFIPVTSSQIQEVGYREETQQLRVRFNSGALYEYDHVTKDQFDNLAGSASAGGYFNAAIKGVHPYRKI